MTDFSRYENKPNKTKPKRARKRIRWGKIGGALIWVAIIAFPATMLYLDSEDLLGEDSFKFSFGVGVDVNIDSKPSAPAPEPEPTLTLEKLRDFYDTKETLTDLAFARADAAFQGERVIFITTLVNVEEACCTGKKADITIDPGIVWDDDYDHTELELTFDVGEKELSEWASWKLGAKLKFDCVYDEVSGILWETPTWESCTITAIQ